LDTTIKYLIDTGMEFGSKLPDKLDREETLDRREGGKDSVVLSNLYAFANVDLLVNDRYTGGNTHNLQLNFVLGGRNLRGYTSKMDWRPAIKINM
jgi:hypothetical protein